MKKLELKSFEKDNLTSESLPEVEPSFEQSENSEEVDLPEKSKRKQRSDKGKKRGTRDSKVSVTETLPLMTTFVTVTLTYLASRNPIFAPTEQEISDISSASNALVLKYLPSIDKWQEEIVFVLVIGLYILPRMQMLGMEKEKRFFDQVNRMELKHDTPDNGEAGKRQVILSQTPIITP